MWEMRRKEEVGECGRSLGITFLWWVEGRGDVNPHVFFMKDSDYEFCFSMRFMVYFRIFFVYNLLSISLVGINVQQDILYVLYII